MSYASIRMEKLTPRIGAEISGVDLAAPLDQQFQEVHDALMEHRVIFFRDQHITLEQHKAFGRRFGELHMHPAAPHCEGHPEILVIHADEKSTQVAGERWHSDVSCDPEPPMGSILHLTSAARRRRHAVRQHVRGLRRAVGPDAALLEGLTAIHDGEQVYRGRYGEEDDRGSSQGRASGRPHASGHRAQGAVRQPVFTTRIVQLRSRKATRILEFLYRHGETPEFQCRFRWQPNSVAFWDNRCVSTTRCGTITRSAATATASRSRATSRSTVPERPLACNGHRLR